MRNLFQYFVFKGCMSNECCCFEITARAYRWALREVCRREVSSTHSSKPFWTHTAAICVVCAKQKLQSRVNLGTCRHHFDFPGCLATSMSLPREVALPLLDAEEAAMHFDMASEDDQLRVLDVKMIVEQLNVTCAQATDALHDAR